MQYKPSDFFVSRQSTAVWSPSFPFYDYTKFEGEKGKKRTAEEQINYLEELINKFPIDSIEDGTG